MLKYSNPDRTPYVLNRLRTLKDSVFVDMDQAVVKRLAEHSLPNEVVGRSWQSVEVVPAMLDYGE